MENYYQVGDNQVIIGSTDGTSQGDNGTACSFEEFLKGNLHDVFISHHGLEVLLKVIAEVERKSGLNHWTRYLQEKSEAWAALPTDPFWANALKSPEQKGSAVLDFPFLRFDTPMGKVIVERSNVTIVVGAEELKYKLSSRYHWAGMFCNGIIHLLGENYSAFDLAGKQIYSSENAFSNLGVNVFVNLKDLYRTGNRVGIFLEFPYSGTEGILEVNVETGSLSKYFPDQKISDHSAEGHS